MERVNVGGPVRGSLGSLEEMMSWTWAFGVAERKGQAQEMFRVRLHQRW